MTRTPTRAGFTLVELLVVLAIAVALMGLAVIVFPGARDQDQVRNSVGDLQANLKMAQAMAIRDKAPRGLRLITDGNGLCTELQFIELPPPILFNRAPGSPPPGLPGWSPDQDARVRFEYEVWPVGTTSPNPPPGSIKTRRCVVENVTGAQAAQVAVNATLFMPVFGAWSKIVGVGPPVPLAPPVPPAPQLYTRDVTLEVYPDAVMGGSTWAVTNHFAIYAAVPPARGGPSGATPLIGEPTVLMSQGACIDLAPGDVTAPTIGSLPGLGTLTDPYFDILFGPDGKLMGNYGGQLFFWVRNNGRVSRAQLQQPEGPALGDAFRRAGEQYFVTVRGSGAIGRAEAVQPNAAGMWAGSTPFDIARSNGQ